MLNDEYYGLRLNDHFPSSRLRRLRLPEYTKIHPEFESLLVRNPERRPGSRPERPQILLVLPAAACHEDALFAARLLGCCDSFLLRVAFSDGSRVVPSSSVPSAYTKAVASHCKYAPVLSDDISEFETDVSAVFLAPDISAAVAGIHHQKVPVYVLGSPATTSPALDNMVYFDRRSCDRRGACVYYMPSQKNRLPCLAIRVVEGLSWALRDYPIAVFGEDRCKFPCGRAVRFCGAVFDPYDRADLYAGCELGIVLSEGAPCRTCYEMRACGLMVVEVNSNLRPRESGSPIQFEVLDEDELVDGIVRLLRDPRKRQMYADNLSAFEFESADSLSTALLGRLGYYI